MAKRLLLDYLIHKNKIKEQIKYIKNSDGYYISENGNVYVDYGKDLLFLKKNQIKQGYYYCDVKYDGLMKHKRIHILVAEAFIDNPNNLPVVGHKDNNKLNPKKDNLYWTTTSENTKKAYDDKLAKNLKGYEDNQSYPIYVFDINKKYLTDFGSASLASKELNISKSTIMRQCKGETKTKPRCGYYFRFQTDYTEQPSVL